MPVMAAVPQDSPLMVAWNAWVISPEFANAKRWATHPDHIDGCLWAAFMQGWVMATNRAGDLHESVNAASDQERYDGDPGAGAMGAVIEYRDLIRAT